MQRDKKTVEGNQIIHTPRKKKVIDYYESESTETSSDNSDDNTEKENMNSRKTDEENFEILEIENSKKDKNGINKSKRNFNTFHSSNIPEDRIKRSRLNNNEVKDNVNNIKNVKDKNIENFHTPAPVVSNENQVFIYWNERGKLQIDAPGGGAPNISFERMLFKRKPTRSVTPKEFENNVLKSINDKKNGNRKI